MVVRQTSCRKLARGARWLIAAWLMVSACDRSTPPTAPAGVRVSPSLLEARANAPLHVLAPRGPDAAARRGVHVQNVPITYHGGSILPMTRVATIYYVTSPIWYPIYNGQPPLGTSGSGNLDQTLIATFIRSVGATPYWGVNTTYWDTVAGGHSVSYVVAHTQTWSTSGFLSKVDSIQNLIAAGFNSGHLTYQKHTVYLVFTQFGVDLGPGGFGTSYCSYHDQFYWNGQLVLFAYLPYAQTYRGSCTPNMKSP